MTVTNRIWHVPLIANLVVGSFLMAQASSLWGVAGLLLLFGVNSTACFIIAESRSAA